MGGHPAGAALIALLRDVSRAAGARGVAVVVVIVTNVLLARALGPEGRGDFLLLTTLALTLFQMSALGLHTSQTVQLARDSRLYGRLAHNSLVLALGLGGTVGLTAAAVLTHGFQWPAGAWLAGLLVPSLLFYLYGSNLILAHGDLSRYNRVTFGRDLFVLVGLSVALLVRPGVWACLLGMLAGNYAFSAVLWWWLPKETACFDWKLFREGWSLAWRSYAACLLTFLTYRVGVFALESNPAQLGYYAIATQLFDVVVMLPSLTATMMLPVLCRRPERARRLTLGIMALTAAGIGLLMAGLAPILPAAIELIFGPAFVPAAAACRALMPAIVLWSISAILSAYVTTCGMPGSYLATWAVTLAATTALSFMLVPSLHAVGAGTALSLGSVPLILGQLLIVRRLRPR